MTKKELALKTIAELRELAAGYGHKLAAKVKSGIVDELANVIQKTGKNLKTKAKKTSKETARTVRAVKKAVSAGKKAAAAARAGALKKKAAGVRKTSAKPARKAAKATISKTAQTKKKTAAPKKAAKAKLSATPAKTSAKTQTMPAALEMKKKDLQGMTVTGLKETARKLGLKQSFPTKDEFVEVLAKDIAKLRAEAKKKATKPAAKKTAKAAAKPVAKKSAARKKIPVEKTKARPSKPKASKEQKPSGPLKERVTKAVGPTVHAMAEKARGLAAQVREKIPSIRPAKPKVSKKVPEPVSGKLPTRDISMPHVATVLPGERETPSPVELLAAIAVEPTELFVSWVLDSSHKPSGPVVLRVQEEGEGHFDVTVGGLSGSAYIKVRPGRHYHVDAGMLDAQGVFMLIRRSNPVVTPPGGVQPLGKHGEGEEQGLPEDFYMFTPQEYGPK